MTNDILTKWADEYEAIWLDDRAKFPYVRYYPLRSNFRDDPVRDEDHDAHVVGYTTLKEDCPPNGPDGTFVRRIFVVKKWDRGYEGDDRVAGHWLNGCPSQSVDPLTVAPGVAGYVTERSLGRS